jgi:hypothetical protein
MGTDMQQAQLTYQTFFKLLFCDLALTFLLLSLDFGSFFRRRFGLFFKLRKAFVS